MEVRKNFDKKRKRDSTGLQVVSRDFLTLFIPPVDSIIRASKLSIKFCKTKKKIKLRFDRNINRIHK